MADIDTSVSLAIEIDGNPYIVSRAELHEALFEVGWLGCDLTTEAGAPDPLELLGKPADLRVARRGGTQAERHYHGVVVEAVRNAGADGRPMVRARVAPRLFRLGKRHGCRIFQDMDVKAIVEAVLDDAGVPDRQWQLGQSYPKRVYTCQYRETDLAFILRLLSEEGINFSIAHDGPDTVVFCDDAKGFGDIPGTKTLPFFTTQGFDSAREQVMWLGRVRARKSDKVSVRDYDFSRPKYELEASAEGTDDGPHALEVYAYPGRFADDATARRYAQTLLDSMQAERDVITGETTVLSFRPGYRFSVEQHPYEAFNQEYVVVRADTTARKERGIAERAGERDYVCRFAAIPTATSKSRPPRRRATADVAGTQTAFTTGPAGSEIHTNAEGQVKVRFLWDRKDPKDDTSSLWIRTEQPHTGDSMFLPRCKWEVTLRYLEGDVDRPLVLGRLYNALTPPPYGLPAGKARSALQTATSPGDGSSNEMRLDDSKGKEEFFVNASKDLTIEVGNNMTLTIRNNETRTIGANAETDITNSSTTVVKGAQTLSVGGKQALAVETFMVDEIAGDHTLTIGGSRDLKIGGDHKKSVGGSASLDVGGHQIDLVVGSVEEKVDGSAEHEVSTALVELTTGKRSLQVGGNHTEAVGAVKIVLSNKGRSVEIGGSLTQKVAGAILAKAKGDHSEKVGGTMLQLAAGATIIKADNVVYEGQSALVAVMGASILIVLPAMVLVLGVSIKLDGACDTLGALILDN